MSGNERKCEAEARREARKEVLNHHFNELVTSIQDDVLYITNECLARRLITPTIHGVISTLSAPEERATKLLTAINACMVHQEEGYTKFLDVLRKRLIFDELIEKLRKSLEEAIDRKVTAECTDGPHSLKHSKHGQRHVNEQDAFNLPIRTTTPMGMELARQTVIKRHMAQLKSSVQGIIAPVASLCQTKELITKETYNKVINTKKPIKYRTKHLLVSVCNCVRSNGKKFDVFMEILERRRSCKELALIIQNDIRELRKGQKSELVMLQHTEHSVAETVTTIPDLRLRRKQVVSSKASYSETDTPISVTEAVGDDGDNKILLGSNTVPVKTIQSVRLDPQREREYQLKMERTQSEAKLEDLRKQEESSKEEKAKLQNSVTELKEEIREKDAEIEQLEKSRDQYKFALETLRVQVSLSEKEQYESKEKQIKPLKEKIAQLEIKIRELEGEKSDLQNQVEGLSRQVDGLQQSLDKMRTTQMSLEAALRETQAALMETQESLNSRNESLKCTEANLKCTEANLKSTEEKLKQAEEKLSVTAQIFQQSTKTINYGIFFIVVVGILVLVWLYLHW